MYTMIASGLIMGGLSIANDMAKNEALERTANTNFNNTLATIDQQYGVNVANLYNQATEVNNQIGAQLTSLGSEQSQAEGQVIADNVERNFYGQSALKNKDKVAVSAALMEDSIIQQGEAAMKDIQMSFSSNMYQRASSIYSASTQRTSMLNQRVSTLETITKGVSAGMSGASMGASLGT